MCIIIYVYKIEMGERGEGITFIFNFLKVFLEFVRILLLFVLCLVSWLQGMWDLSAPRQEIEPSTPELEGEILTTEPSGQVTQPLKE